MPNIRRDLLALLALSVAFQALPARGRSVEPEPSDLPDTATLRQWVEEIKVAPRGPFQSIQWFCRDGTVQPPKAYACADHGGGIQHGLWTDRVASMRAGGYEIANLLADLDVARFTGPAPDLDTLTQILLERFLMRADAGWIFRGAFDYRGAFQIEDEEAGANALAEAMLADPEWRAPARFALLRETVRLLPLQADSVTASAVRQLAIDIADQDRGFANLRAKIHGAPDAADAAAVREYAGTRGRPELAGLYEQIARSIDELYAEKGAVVALRDLAQRSEDPALAQTLEAIAGELDAAPGAAARFRLANARMATLRQRFQADETSGGGLELLLASLALEREAYAAGNTLIGDMGGASRRERIRKINESLDGLYGTGFLSRRQFAALRGAINAVVTKRTISVDDYRQTLRYLSRVPEWSARWLEFNFSPASDRSSPWRTSIPRTACAAAPCSSTARRSTVSCATRTSWQGCGASCSVGTSAPGCAPSTRDSHAGRSARAPTPRRPRASTATASTCSRKPPRTSRRWRAS